MARKLTAVMVTDPEAPPDVQLLVAARALQGGLSAILVRLPSATAHGIYELTRRLRPLTRSHGSLLLVSDRADVALAAGADGVHLGRRSLPPAAARRIVGPDVLLGTSVHNLDETGQAVEQGADYLFFGHLFSTPSHPDSAPRGLEAYREAVLRSRIPVLAIGGVNESNVAEIARAGGPGAAAITAFSTSEDPAATARAFRAAFGA